MPYLYRAGRTRGLALWLFRQIAASGGMSVKVQIRTHVGIDACGQTRDVPESKRADGIDE